MEKLKKRPENVDRLKELEATGLVKKRFAEIPPRVEYSTTRDGQELRKLVIPLMKWANSRDHGKQNVKNGVDILPLE
jgi:DNA-binding HxlR family transcriptional regulator